MPRKSKEGAVYPENWEEIARGVKDAAGWCCIRCGHAHAPSEGYTLTVHHLDLDPSNCKWWNLLALCQRCHLSVQSRVNLDRPWVFVEHTHWFRVYVAGWYASKYLGVERTREEIEQNLDIYLSLERIAVLGRA